MKLTFSLLSQRRAKALPFLIPIRQRPFTHVSAPLIPDGPYTYTHPDTGSSEDPSELTFTKGQILDILSTSDRWWEARTTDGKTGSEYHLCSNDEIVFHVHV